MYERRLKIFLILLFLVTTVIALRAAHIQIIQHDHWNEAAKEAMKRESYVETTRGRIVDFRGEELAVDLPCMDIAVDYRVIPAEPDKRWVAEKARQRLRHREGAAYTNADRATRKKMFEEEAAAVRADIENMWKRLGEFLPPGQDIQTVRDQIVQRVEQRKRYIWYKNYEAAVKEHKESDPAPLWQRWLLGDSTDGPKLDEFQVEVAEETQAHVILSDVDGETMNYFGKHIDRYPGLLTRPGVHRVYPHNDVACHVLGRLAKVTRDDIKANNGELADLRRYLMNDSIGRSGIEALAEPTLRGTRGRLYKYVGEDGAREDAKPVPGEDVRISIDIVLQKQIQSAFEQTQIPNPDKTFDVHEMHGAAVIIDVPTGQIRAMVSYPTFDNNKFDELYSQMVRDDINNRLLNRATQYPLEPGSTIKPVVGIGAISDGLFAHDGKIECTGYLVIHGKRYKVGRCWVASKFHNVLGGAVAHHPVPWDDPHPDGWLTYSDALQRSCNPFFETLADELGLEGLSKWYERFGIGRTVGIGIPEMAGRLPRSFSGPTSDRRAATWFAGIGQGQIAATPLQMANVAATIARDGVWVRPTLVMPGTKIDHRLVRKGGPQWEADRVDLGLNAEGVRALKDGMIRVANTKAGTGNKLKRSDLLVAAKTGTAQAAKFAVPIRDEAGKYVKDERGFIKRRVLEPSVHGNLNPEAVWYRAFGAEGKDLNHGWIIGFAPANNPQVAFAVMVEYGGSGGGVAGGIAQKMLEACIEHGYLNKSPVESKPVAETELMYEVARNGR
jgi:penicillin-binding protein 2